MSQLVTTHFVQQYTTNVQLLLQQKGSRLRGSVMEGAHTGEQAVPVDQIGKVTATKRTTRYPDLTPQDTPTDRRWVFPSDYDWNDLVDNADKLRMLIDPMSSYVQNGTYAMGRAMDDEIITAFFGTAKTGKAAGTSTTFPAAQQISVSFGAAAAVGLTIAKLREAKRLLLAAEVDIDNDPLYCVLTAKQHDNMLGEAQAISLDYNDRPVLVQGKITSFMGFNFLQCERLVTNGSGYRRVPAYAKSGMHLGMWNDIRTDVSQRKSKAGLPWQVYVYGTFGATRLEEAKTVEIPCSEA
jgi:hypothetical protein